MFWVFNVGYILVNRYIEMCLDIHTTQEKLEHLITRNKQKNMDVQQVDMCSKNDPKCEKTTYQKQQRRKRFAIKQAMHNKCVKQFQQYTYMYAKINICACNMLKQSTQISILLKYRTNSSVMHPTYSSHVRARPGEPGPVLTS
jgi:hypothetical protein